MADVRGWCFGALLVGVGVTAAEAAPILLPPGDPNAGGLSEDAKLAILFHHRYDDVTIPESWLRRVTPPAPMEVLPLALDAGDLVPATDGDTTPAVSAAIPEPSTLLLLGLGALGTAFARRKRTA